MHTGSEKRFTLAQMAQTSSHKHRPAQARRPLSWYRSLLSTLKILKSDREHPAFLLVDYRPDKKLVMQNRGGRRVFDTIHRFTRDGRRRGH